MSDSFARSSCAHRPSAFAEAVEKWSNYSHVWENNTAYFRAYVCMNIHYEAVKETCEATEARLVFALGIFGLIGSVLSTATLFRRPFVPADVYLYRLVGAVETMHMSVLALMHGLTIYVDCGSYYACTLFSAHLYMTLTNGCADAVEFVVVFLCVERTVACLAPQHFHRIHRLFTYRTVAVLSVCSSVPLNIIHSFDVRIVVESDQPSVQKYREEQSFFAGTWIYARVMDAQLVRFCVVAPLIIISTTGSVIGLNQAARRKRRLRGNMHNISVIDGRKEAGKRNHDDRKQSIGQSKAVARSRKEIKQMIELCCLQLCLAVPVVINYMLCLVERICKIGLIERNRLWEEPFRTMTYDQAKWIIIRATMLEYLRFSINVTHMLAHGLHFYLYLAFSAKFRHTFGKWLIGRRLYGRWATDRQPFVSGEGLSTGYDRVRTTGATTNNFEMSKVHANYTGHTHQSK